MNIRSPLLALILFAIAPTLQAQKDQSLVYINQHLGFNVPGYSYSQDSFPCDIDEHLVAYIIDDGRKSNINLEAVATADKIRNGVVPVLAMDIEELVLDKDHRFGTNTRHTLPKVMVTTAMIKGEQMQTAKHTCAIATLNEFTPSSNILDMGTTTTVCGATKKCLKDLSKDIVEWVIPQID